MEKLPTPELLPTQLRIRGLCDAIHELRAEPSQLTFKRIELQTDPAELESRLKATTFGSLMLKDGESFSIEDPTGYYPNLGMIAGEVKALGATATGWIWSDRAYGRDSDGWSCQLDVQLWYENDKAEASQTISAHTSSYQAGIPTLSRQLGSIAYAETGYEGHGFKHEVNMPSEAVAEFLAIVEPLVKRASGSS